MAALGEVDILLQPNPNSNDLNYAKDLDFYMRRAYVLYAMSGL